MIPLPFRLASRADESLYSVLARWSRRLGDPPRADLERVVFGQKLALYDDLPVGIGRLAERGWLCGEAKSAVVGMTLFRYHSAFVDAGRRAAAMQAMLADGPWPHAALNSWRAEAKPADRLRFCRACLAEQLAENADARWRRAHQLPTVLVCPDHGEVLRDSSVGRRVRRSRYVPASPAVCRPDAPPAVVGADGEASEALLRLARASARLLAVEARPLAAIRSGYRSRLNLGDPRDPPPSWLSGEVSSFWAPVLRMAPEWAGALAGPRWVPVALGGAAPPLHHLLLQGWMDAEFGSNGDPCLSPEPVHGAAAEG